MPRPWASGFHCLVNACTGMPRGSVKHGGQGDPTGGSSPGLGRGRPARDAPASARVDRGRLRLLDLPDIGLRPLRPVVQRAAVG